MTTRLLMFLIFPVSCSVWAETGKTGYVPPAPVVTTESMVQMMGGLLLVLAVIGGLAWLLKRFSLVQNAAGGVVKVVAATGVGQRERVVVVEVDKTWLVLGVAPGRVNKLHAMEKPQSDAGNSAPGDQTADTFAAQLNQSIKKENVE